MSPPPFGDNLYDFSVPASTQLCSLCPTPLPCFLSMSVSLLSMSISLPSVSISLLSMSVSLPSVSISLPPVSVSPPASLVLSSSAVAHLVSMPRSESSIDIPVPSSLAPVSSSSSSMPASLSLTASSLHVPSVSKSSPLSMLAASSTQSESNLYTTNRKDAWDLPAPSQTLFTKHGVVVVVTNPMDVNLISKTDKLICPLVLCCQSLHSNSRH